MSASLFFPRAYHLCAGPKQKTNAIKHTEQPCPAPPGSFSGAGLCLSYTVTAQGQHSPELKAQHVCGKFKFPRRYHSRSYCNKNNCEVQIPQIYIKYWLSKKKNNLQIISYNHPRIIRQINIISTCCTFKTYSQQPALIFWRALGYTVTQNLSLLLSRCILY